MQNSNQRSCVADSSRWARRGRERRSDATTALTPLTGEIRQSIRDTLSDQLQFVSGGKRATTDTIQTYSAALETNARLGTLTSTQTPRGRSLGGVAFDRFS